MKNSVLNYIKLIICYLINVGVLSLLKVNNIIDISWIGVFIDPILAIAAIFIILVALSVIIMILLSKSNENMEEEIRYLYGDK